MSLREDFARDLKKAGDRQGGLEFRLTYWQPIADEILSRYEIRPRPTITITRAVQTCYACPSQWDAWDQDDRYLYLRFRHGHGTARRRDDDGRRLVAEFSTDDQYDGVISLEEFARRAGFQLAEGVW